MKRFSLALIAAATFVMAGNAHAATSCTTRQSGSVSITSCSNSYRAGGVTQCRSYRSGSVVKTNCR